MNQSDTLALASNAAALMEQFERICADLNRQQRRLVQHLEQVTQSLPGLTVRSVQETLQRVPDALIRQVQNGLDEPVAGFEKRLQHAGSLISEGAQSLATQRMQRLLLWKSAAVTLGSLLLLLAGGGWLLMQYRQDIRDNQLRAELLRAYNAADVTLCESRLCANIKTQGPAYGDHSQYQLVRSR
ncbi:relaxation protein [Xanthomonas cerealis pv. cerealis]|uniref:Relaxation protein n=1 Tax=Xanthomonas cerealis pv. cerealis TaxID=152263 RepID=A0A514ECU6_9XANT|nr:MULTISPECIES: hypothetical protein [Xanthomonas]MCC8554375.1 relaxation protein [Xanthomonas hortorum pv. gardneri]QDI03834.1 relaxation protein [Xanthomonas translucens pv. cerealis]QEO26379.1 relaxation protein [Xanthomonas translucens pv. undulosa]WLA10274.1 relaxation protein [Xanthomonas translucens]